MPEKMEFTKQEIKQQLCVVYQKNGAGTSLDFNKIDLHNNSSPECVKADSSCVQEESAPLSNTPGDKSALTLIRTSS